MSWHPGASSAAANLHKFPNLGGALGTAAPWPATRPVNPILPQLCAAALAGGHKAVAQQWLQQWPPPMQAAWGPVWAKVFESVPDDVDWGAFVQGEQRYASQPVAGARQDYPVIASAGQACLRRAAAGHGTGLAPVVLVPSMVNRGFVLDLLPRFSLVEFLRAAGHPVLVVDWGEPNPMQPRTLDQVIAEQLVPLLQAGAAAHGPLAVFGYCMGGLLALAATLVLAARGDTQTVAKLSVAAMPWDFSATATHGHVAHIHASQARGVLAPWLSGLPVLAPEVLAHYFWLLDPWSPVRRLMAFGREPDPARVAHLTALEDWLADGLALDGPVAKQMLQEWYADNAPMRGAWQVAGVPMRPSDVPCPLQVVLTQRDALVPLASALPLVGQTRAAQVAMAATGHVGLVCGRQAVEQLYRPLLGFVRG